MDKGTMRAQLTQMGDAAQNMAATLADGDLKTVLLDIYQGTQKALAGVDALPDSVA